MNSSFDVRNNITTGAVLALALFAWCEPADAFMPSEAARKKCPSFRLSDFQAQPENSYNLGGPGFVSFWHNGKQVCACNYDKNFCFQFIDPKPHLRSPRSHNDHPSRMRFARIVFGEVDR